MAKDTQQIERILAGLRQAWSKSPERSLVELLDQVLPGFSREPLAYTDGEIERLLTRYNYRNR